MIKATNSTRNTELWIFREGMYKSISIWSLAPSELRENIPTTYEQQMQTIVLNKFL